MLKNMKISLQLLLLNIVGIIAIIIIIGSGYSALNSISHNVETIHKDTKILKEQTVTLSNIIQKIKLDISLTKMEAFESIVSKKIVSKNNAYLKSLNNTKKDLLALKSFLNKYKKSNKKLHNIHYKLNKNFKTYYLILETLQEEIDEDYAYGIEILNDEVKPIEKMLFKSIDNLLNKTTKKFHDKFEEMETQVINTNKLVTSSTTTNIIVGILAIILFLVLATLISKNIQSSIEIFKTELLGFFRYLNQDTTEINMLEESNTEIGEMSKVVNVNISKIKKGMDDDRALIEDAQIVISRVKHGWYSQYIEKSTSNESLNGFKNSVNEMIKSIKNHFLEMNVVLEEYAKNDYVKELELQGIEKGGVFEILISDINLLRNAITNILIQNKSNGLTLQDSSDTLLNNVQSLSTATNQAAASLEETAGALEEITSNILNNTQNVVKMASYGNMVKTSVSKGQDLANQTTMAMDKKILK